MYEYVCVHVCDFSLLRSELLKPAPPRAGPEVWGQLSQLEAPGWSLRKSQATLRGYKKAEGREGSGRRGPG